MDTFEIDALDLVLMRHAAINWDPTESGAPTVDPACPLGSTSMKSDVLALAQSSGLPLNAGDLQSRFDRLDSTLEIALRIGVVEAGEYESPDRLFGCRSPLDTRSRVDIANIAAVALKNPTRRQPTVRLKLTKEHLVLLRNAMVRTTDWADELDDHDLITTPGIDPKRPYGEMTNVVLDIARLLNVPQSPDRALSAQEKRRLLALHEDMRSALIVFLANVKLTAGKYRVNQEGHWEKEK
ncbi:MAG: hypothetical protein ABIQ70_07750 [Dokdonella sp.]